MGVYLNSSGRSLTEYPRPSVAADTAVLTVATARRGASRQASLPVLLMSRPSPGDPLCALPGTFVHEGETLGQAALRALRGKAGVVGLAPRQLHVFDEPDRDDRGWVLSVGHVDVVRAECLVPAVEARGRSLSLASVDSVLRGRRRLAFDHRDVVRLAAADVRRRSEETPDPDGLLSEPFTMRELWLLHAAVRGHAGDASRDTFRRRMEPLLEATGELPSGTVGKPAALFRHR